MSLTSSCHTDLINKPLTAPNDLSRDKMEYAPLSSAQTGNQVASEPQGSEYFSGHQQQDHWQQQQQQQFRGGACGLDHGWKDSEGLSRAHSLGLLHVLSTIFSGV